MTRGFEFSLFPAHWIERARLHAMAVVCVGLVMDGSFQVNLTSLAFALMVVAVDKARLSTNCWQ